MSVSGALVDSLCSSDLELAAPGCHLGVVVRRRGLQCNLRTPGGGVVLGILQATEPAARWAVEHILFLAYLWPIWPIWRDSRVELEVISDANWKIIGVASLQFGQIPSVPLADSPCFLCVTRYSSEMERPYYFSVIDQSKILRLPTEEGRGLSGPRPLFISHRPF